MRIWYDLEFLEDGRTIDLISIGMVRADGRTLYAVNDELIHAPKGVSDRPDSLYSRVCGHDWLMANVVPHLPLCSPDGRQRTMSAPGDGGYFHLDPEHSAVLPLRLVRAQVREFILGGGPDVELWANYGAYDHVRLAWLWGPMIALPKGVPMVTHDIQTLALLAGQEARNTVPDQEGALHNALEDALYNRELWEHYWAALTTMPVMDLS